MSELMEEQRQMARLTSTATCIRPSCSPFRRGLCTPDLEHYALAGVYDYYHLNRSFYRSTAPLAGPLYQHDYLLVLNAGSSSAFPTTMIIMISCAPRNPIILSY